MASLISAVHWIPRGKAARHPARTNLTSDEEVARISALTGIEFADAQKQLEHAQKAAEGMGQDDGWEDDEEEEDGEDAAMDEDSAAAKPNGDAAAQATKQPEDPEDLSRYRLDEYDDDEDAPADAATGSMGAFSNIRGLTFHRNNDEDPYITMKDDDDADSNDSREALEVLPSDNLIITAKTEDDVSQVEAYVYSAEDSNLYVHHDLMLPSFPLCLEWLDYRPAAAAGASADQNGGAAGAPQSLNGKVGEQGSFIAVGTMDPEIEIWSMDVVEACFPDAILGQKDLTEALNAPLGTGKKKKRQSKARVPNDTHHVDAVLGLSWNKLARNILASASADTTVKLWDLSRPCSGASGSALRSFNSIHTDKVQSVVWNTSGSSAGSGAVSAAAASVLLTGSFDGTLRVFDTRAPETSSVTARVDSDVECVRWHPWRENVFLASTENGTVQCFDARALPSSSSSAKASASARNAVWTLSAHTGACTAFDVNPHLPGCLVTAGSDRQTKLWSIAENELASDAAAKAKPASISLVTNRDLEAVSRALQRRSDAARVTRF